MLLFTEGCKSFFTYEFKLQIINTFFIHTNRFSDFLGLHSRLADKYAKEGRIIPPAPEKSIIGRKFEIILNISILFKLNFFLIEGMAKVKVSKNESASGSEFVEQRRAQLERYKSYNFQEINLFYHEGCFFNM